MMGWLKALSRTRDVMKGITRFVLGGRTIDSSDLETLELELHKADIPARLIAMWITEIQRPGSISAPIKRLHDILSQQFKSREPFSWPNHHPAVILITGVNGSGKTTTTAKLGKLAVKAGRKPLLAAADTFRAAGTEQLRIWGNRLGCDLVSGTQGSDPAAVAYDAVRAGVARKCDLVLIDTAGRMHTKQHLMSELQKVKRAIQKALPGAPHESWIVLDATIGHNAINQARIFKESIGLTGAIITKLDGSSKAGFVVALESELEIPILFAGLGEGEDDLVSFRPDEFIKALLLGVGDSQSS